MGCDAKINVTNAQRHNETSVLHHLSLLKCCFLKAKQEILKKEKEIQSLKHRTKSEILSLKEEGLKKEKQIVRLKEEMERLKNETQSEISLLKEESQRLERKFNQISEMTNQNKDQTLQIMQITLRIQSFRKCYKSNNHPRNLFKKNDNSCYASAVNSDFKNKENDWIVFTDTNHRKISHLSGFHLRQGKYDNSIRDMCISVSSDKASWIVCHIPSKITLKKSNEIQKIELNWNQNIQNTFQFIRVSFLSNHGETRSHYCRLNYIYYFALFGVICE